MLSDPFQGSSTKRIEANADKIKVANILPDGVAELEAEAALNEFWERATGASEPAGAAEVEVGVSVLLPDAETTGAAVGDMEGAVV